MQRELKLCEYLSEEWSNYFTKKSTVKNLLKRIKIPGAFQEIVDHKLVDYRHIILRFKYIDSNDSKPKNGQLMVVSGNPSFNEMIELVFDYGEVSDIKIVVYDEWTDPRTKYDWAYEYPYVIHFADKINPRYRNIWEVTVKGSMKDDIKQNLKYTVKLNPNNKFYHWDEKVDRIPTKDEMIEAEFWCVYYPKGGEYRTLGNWINEEVYKPLREKAGVEIKPGWGPEGLMLFIQHDCSDMDYFHSMFKDDKGCISNNWDDEKLIKCKIGGGNAVDAYYVKVNDIPFSKGLASTDKEKQKYALEVNEHMDVLARKLIRSAELTYAYRCDPDSFKISK